MGQFQITLNTLLRATSKLSKLWVKWIDWNHNGSKAGLGEALPNTQRHMCGNDYGSCPNFSTIKAIELILWLMLNTIDPAEEWDESDGKDFFFKKNSASCDFMCKMWKRGKNYTKHTRSCYCTVFWMNQTAPFVSATWNQRCWDCCKGLAFLSSFLLPFPSSFT